MRLLKLTFVVPLALSASCQCAEETQEELRARIVQESVAAREVIEAHNANAESWYLAGNIDAVANLFAEDAWMMPPNMPALVGREAIRTHWSTLVQWGDWHFELRTESVEANGPLAIERGTYKLRFDPGPEAPPGMGKMEDKGNYLVHWRLINGEWMAVADCPSSEMPLPSPNPAGQED